MSTGFGYRSELRRQQAAVVGEVLPLVRDLRRMGSAALDLCSVAVGRLDAHYERGLNVWDVAAAALVATELGVRLTGGPFGDAGPGLPGDLTLAARPPLHADLRDALVKAHAVTDGPGGQAPGTTR